MPLVRKPLPVRKLTDQQLWSTMHGRIAMIEAECFHIRGRDPIANAARDAMDCLAELRFRGQQLGLVAAELPFPRELPQVAQVGLIPPRA